MESQKDKNNKKPQAPDYEPYPHDEDIYEQNRKRPYDESEEDWGSDDLDDIYEDYEDDDDDDDVDMSNYYDDDTQVDDMDDFPASFRRMIDTPEDDDWNTENFDTDHTGEDLDIPGSELDDDDEDIGEEDEENNYYSLGGPRKKS